MLENRSEFKVFKLDYPASAIFGETYVITSLTVFSSFCKAEYYILTSKNADSYSHGEFTYHGEGNKFEDFEIDNEFLLSECLSLAENQLLEFVGVFLDKPNNLIHNISNISFSECAYRPFVGVWMRGRFKTEIRRISTSTNNSVLAPYLQSVTRLQSFVFTESY